LIRNEKFNIMNELLDFKYNYQYRAIENAVSATWRISFNT
jgi:hypothetical protein